MPALVALDRWCPEAAVAWVLGGRGQQWLGSRIDRQLAAEVDEELDTNPCRPELGESTLSFVTRATPHRPGSHAVYHESSAPFQRRESSLER